MKVLISIHLKISFIIIKTCNFNMLYVWNARNLFYLFTYLKSNGTDGKFAKNVKQNFRNNRL